jgi:NAD(P)H-flavin reductase
MLLSSAQGFTVGSVQAAFGAPKMVKSPTAARLPDARMTEKSGGKRLRRDQRSLLFMGWGSDPIWSDAKVTESKLACPSGKSVLVSVAVPPETAKDYTVPGQYVQIRADEEDEKPVFMAISSPPDPENASFQFLVKKTTNNLLSEAKAGTAIQISQVLGSGYAMEENLEGYKYDFPTQNVLLFAAGSGIAPLAAVVESGQLNVKGGGRTARLYYGEQTADDLCLTDRFAAWEEAGCEVVPVLSQPDDSWQGRTGYVQNALEEDGIAIPRNSGALLCGMKGMTEAVKELLLAAGVFEGRVLFNF